jgi:hypothetical protein
VKTIVLPWTKDGYYRFSDLPRLIAEALHPTSDEAEQVWVTAGICTKKTQQNGGGDAASIPTDMGLNEATLVLLEYKAAMDDWQRSLEKAATSQECIPQGIRVLNPSTFLPLESFGPNVLAQGIIHLGELQRWGSGCSIDFSTSIPGVVIVRPVRPTDVPAELMALKPDQTVTYVVNYVGEGKVEGPWSAGNVIADITDVIKRQKSGRYTIDEAAQIVVSAYRKGSAQAMRDDMVASVRAGDLRAFDPWTLRPKSTSEQVRPRSDYVKVEDVNAWLEKNRDEMVFPASEQPRHPAALERKLTVQEAIADYVIEVMSANPAYTAKNLYIHMRRKAGTDGSPFATLSNGAELFCTKACAPCGLSSVSAALTAYRCRK